MKYFFERTNFMHQIRLALIGAGDRGFVYGRYALDHPDDVQFVAVADPVAARRESFAAAHHIPADNQFATWEHLPAQPPLADAVIVATPDYLHTAPTIAALERGYNVLLEKPMANTLDDCIRLVQTAERT